MTCQRERKIEIAIPGMEKSLCSSHENKETDDNVLDFNFDYSENEIDENENSNDDDISNYEYSQQYCFFCFHLTGRSASSS